MKRLLVTASVLLVAAGCGTYDFRRGVDERGKARFDVLHADLELKNAPLEQSLWLPLFYYHRSIFQSEGLDADPALHNPALDGSSGSVRYPSGFVFDTTLGIAPLFFLSSRYQAHYDRQGMLYEERELARGFWKLWTIQQSRVRVPQGVREEIRVGILFGLIDMPTSVTYRGGGLD